MRTTFNSKPQVSEHPFRADGEVCSTATRSQKTQVCILKWAGFMHEQIPFSFNSATENPSARLTILLSDGPSTNSTHIASTLSTRFSSIRF
jgi:hypothetical protein